MTQAYVCACTHARARAFTHSLDAAKIVILADPTFLLRYVTLQIQGKEYSVCLLITFSITSQCNYVCPFSPTDHELRQGTGWICLLYDYPTGSDLVSSAIKYLINNMQSTKKNKIYRLKKISHIVKLFLKKMLNHLVKNMANIFSFILFSNLLKSFLRHPSLPQMYFIIFFQLFQFLFNTKK